MSKYIHNEELHNLRAPNILVPYLMKLFNPASVVDVGCGIGNFLYVFKNMGKIDILGIDGKWVEKDKLYIELSEFAEMDLEQPINLHRKFDLVLCLEVAEHLNEKSSDTIVQTLVSLGDIIVFSAAIPGQGGQNHINEQEYSYWQKKFSRHHFSFYDIFRMKFWENQGIDWWYRQNLFLIARDSINFPAEISQHKISGTPLIFIQPELFNETIRNRNREIEQAVRNREIKLSDFFIGLKRKIKKFIKSIFH